MDIYNQKVTVARPVVTPRFTVQAARLEIGPIGCLACTSGDSPIFDFEQNILFGY